MTEQEIRDIFKEIDNAINFSLTKAICKGFMESYERIKRNHLNEERIK